MGEPGSALGRLLSATKVSARMKDKSKAGGTRSVATRVVDSDGVVEELLAGRMETQRLSVTSKKNVRDERPKTVYVLGERPARDKAVPRAKEGCARTLKYRQLNSTSRRRIHSVPSYNHFKQYFEDETEFVYGSDVRDRGDEVMPSKKSALGWEGRGTVSWG